MKPKRKQIFSDGGQLLHFGDGTEKIRVFFLERDDTFRDKKFIDYLLGVFNDKGFAVSMLYPPFEAYRRTLDPDFKLRAMPQPLRKLRMGFSLLFHPAYWRFYFRSYRETTYPLENRVQSLLKAFPTLPPLPTFILGRSSGARIATLVADQLGLTGVICVGYPFRNPERAEEPERYRHLEFLKTPCLILQGEKDPYGGLGLKEAYKLSESITLKFIEVDHDFILTEEARLKFFEHIDHFISKNTGQVSP